MIDPDNPLPEASFPWRRTLTFLSTAAVFYLLHAALQLTPAQDILAFAQWLLAALVILWLLYFGGASADDVGRLIARVRLTLLRPPGPTHDRPPAQPALPPGAEADLPPWKRAP